MTTQTTSALSEGLATFFAAFTQISSEATQPALSARLAQFFDHFAKCRTSPGVASIPCPALDTERLTEFLAGLKKPLAAARSGAFLFDPWEVGGLGRDEVRNVAVLAWLLNPYGSHGLCAAPLNALLTTLHKQVTRIPGCLVGRGRIRTEINPDGDIGDRVDIEIDTDESYLILEAKIDALEQSNQIERYCQQATARAGRRPWGVIFLTPSGRKPTSAGSFANREEIFCLSWRQLAALLEGSLPQRSPAYVPSASRQSAGFAVRCFLKKMRLF